MFEKIIGNAKAKDYLRYTAEKGTAGNSLLFAGPDGIGKSLFAEAFAKLLLCQEDPEGLQQQRIDSGNHPDIHVYRPEGKVGMHSIAAMRQLTEEVYLKPFEGKKKIFIIHDADRMLSFSANALLKTFEEPAEDTTIILLSSSPLSLLPTILSRCRTLRFHALSIDEITSFLMRQYGKSSNEAQGIAALAQGSLGKAVRLAQEGPNPLRTALLNALAKGRVSSYKQLTEVITAIAEQLETKKKEIEADVRALLIPGKGEDFTAVQKQNLEKEIEGAVAMYTIQETCALFDVVLGWYRDMHLLGVNGSRAYLINSDYAEACASALERGELIALETVQKAVSEARLALERSTSPQICLENLFLKLNFL